MTPSSAPIGAPFTITGSNFGTYGGANTRVKFGRVTAPVSVWNNFTITGTVPGAAAPGATKVVVERVSGAGLSQSATQAFLVLVPTISTITPSYGPATTVVTVSGHGFGPYAGTNTRLLVGGSTVAVSVWNDTTIRWTVPASLSDGDYPVVVRRTPAGGTVESASATFTVGTGFGGMSLGFGASQPLAVQPDQNFEGLLSVSAAEGGRVETPAKAAVELPPNAMDSDTEISVKRLRSDGLRAQAAETARVKAAGEAIEFGPDGARFNAPVWIELPYDPALTPDESMVSIHYYDPLRRAWDALPSVVDRARKVVRAQTDHFSIYQPMAIGVTTAAQDEFYLREHYAFPNPVRSGVVTFRVLPGLADSVEVRVYDVAGRKVYSSTDFAHTAPGGEHQYDHAWSVSGIGSGVYTYAIKASRSGQRTISKTGKVGVIK